MERFLGFGLMSLILATHELPSIVPEAYLRMLFCPLEPRQSTAKTTAQGTVRSVFRDDWERGSQLKVPFRQAFWAPTPVGNPNLKI